MAKEQITLTSIEEIKNRWASYCVNTRQYRVKNKDYKDLQYIDKLILDGLDNGTINTRLERYRKIRITDESLNKKREEFNKKMSKPSKRIVLSKRGKSFLHYFNEELEDNPYYNQKVVWCNDCNRTHRINSDIAWDHNVKPTPVKCEVNEDHCWNMKDISQKKIIGIDIHNHDYRDTGLFIMHREGVVEECMVCGRKGLEELTFIGGKIDITINQLKKVTDYIQSIKHLEFKKLNEIVCKKYEFADGEIMIRIPEFDKKIREIQDLEDYIIINLF